MPANKIIIVVIAVAMMALQACSGCKREMESVRVAGQALELSPQKQLPQDPQPQTSGPRIIDIKARPYEGPAPVKDSAAPAGDVAVTIASPAPVKLQVPPGAAMEDALSKRLTDKLKEANIPFNEKNPPKIYTSNQNINEFSSFYEAKGQRVSRMSIPASVLIRPLLQDHPELASKVDVDALDKVTINQVVVEGTGISAADKYIDPDTLQVVDKLFVTDMPSDMGKKE